MSQTRADSAYHTFNEILGQPPAWRDILREVAERAADLRGYWRSEQPPEVIFTGCGSPHYLARSAAALFQGVVGARAQVHPASDLMLFPEIALPPVGPRLLVAISRSGETTEIIRAIGTFGERTGGPTIAITCYEGTSLERAASLTVIAREAHEQSMAQTRSFTSMLLGVQGLIFTLAGRPLSDAFLALPEHCAALLERYSGLAQQIGRESAFQRFFFLGGGPLYGLACEAMLKMKEMSLSYSEAYHFMEFRHGPMSMVDDRTLVVGLVSEHARAHEGAVLREMRGLGARVLAVTPAELPAEQADAQILLPPGLADDERGALYLPVLQLMTFYRALHNGLDPDRPTNLNAVVHLDVDAIEGGRS
jgi:glucosamine--fructose-6-phosphate aminotransferase (isomerizing)